MKIEIPMEYIKLNPITICPETFIPIMNIAVQKNYYDNIEKDYIVETIDFDDTKIIEYINNGGYYEESGIELAYSVEDFNISDHGVETQEYRILSEIYNINNPHRRPICFHAIKKDMLTAKEVTIILAKRYKKILEPIKDIDTKLDKTSNSNLLWMCNRIITDDLPEDKISRWIGFIQGVMSVKGYISVDEERDFSRPLFHDVYQNNNIDIPETKEKEKETNIKDKEGEIKIRLCYNTWDKNNNVSEYRSPEFYVTEKQIIFLNFITSIVKYRNGGHNVGKAINYINENWIEFEEIITDFTRDYIWNLGGDTEVMKNFDEEILYMLIEWFYDNEYIPKKFYDYDSVSEVNPDGFINDGGVFAFEKIGN